MIRQAHQNDRFAMVRMARDFVAAADRPVPFDAAYAERSVIEWVEAADKLALVLEQDGLCGMICAASILSPLIPMRIAIEQVLWVDPRARGRGVLGLVRAYEGWAKEQECEAVTLATIQNKAADRLYQRLGYERAETHFVKGI
jgi:GNAT superfamily N-acetyltransferase